MRARRGFRPAGAAGVGDAEQQSMGRPGGEAGEAPPGAVAAYLGLCLVLVSLVVFACYIRIQRLTCWLMPSRGTHRQGSQQNPAGAKPAAAPKEAVHVSLVVAGQDDEVVGCCAGRVAAKKPSARKCDAHSQPQRGREMPKGYPPPSRVDVAAMCGERTKLGASNRPVEVAMHSDIESDAGLVAAAAPGMADRPLVFVGTGQSVIYTFEFVRLPPSARTLRHAPCTLRHAPCLLHHADRG